MRHCMHMDLSGNRQRKRRLHPERKNIYKYKKGRMTPVRQRVQKIIARRGYAPGGRRRNGCSRRVTVNGETARPGDQADPDTDCIAVDGKPLSGSKEKVYLMLHKPRGYVTTLSDEFGAQDCCGANRELRRAGVSCGTT